MRGDLDAGLIAAGLGGGGGDECHNIIIELYFSDNTAICRSTRPISSMRGCSKKEGCRERSGALTSLSAGSLAIGNLREV